jgi:hypothetical protein
MAWQAENVVFVLMSPASEPDPYAIFRALVGAAPAALNPLPPTMPGSVAQGPIGEFQLQVIGRPGRMELSLTVPPSDDNQRGLIEDSASALDRLVEFAKESLNLHPVHRLSLVIHLAMVMDSIEEARKKFFERTGAREVDCVATDLFFQYNSPTETTQGDVRLNRLIKWGVSSQTVGKVSVQSGTALPTVMQSIEYHSLNLFLDVNIALQGDAIPLDRAKIFLEDIARETKALILNADGNAS